LRLTHHTQPSNTAQIIAKAKKENIRERCFSEASTAVNEIPDSFDPTPLPRPAQPSCHWWVVV
jgi:hypothetical protein